MSASLLKNLFSSKVIDVDAIFWCFMLKMFCYGSADMRRVIQSLTFFFCFFMPINFAYAQTTIEVEVVECH